MIGWQSITIARSCFSEFGEFRRTTYICEITKLLAKWARRYWDEYNRLEGLEPIDWASEAREKGNRHGIGLDDQETTLHSI